MNAIFIFSNRLPRAAISAIVILLLATIGSQSVRACTNILVTKGASTDGSVMITYACDGEFHPHLRIKPAATYEPGEMLQITTWGGEVRGEIPQVERTYAVVGLMNEHQLAISETTFVGRPELVNPDGLLHYWDLMQLACSEPRLPEKP